MEDIFTWEDTYPIALALIERFPNIKLEDVSLRNIYSWTLSLPQFSDEPELANDGILMAIYQEWFEEVNPL